MMIITVAGLECKARSASPDELREKLKRWSIVFSMKETHPMQHYYEPNDAYFRKHLQKLLKAHGENGL
jgi:hypothetical protein